MTGFSRRTVLRMLGLAAAGSAGCMGGSTDVPDGDVMVGPGGSLRFEPAEYTVGVGETVTWSFASPGHNVCCVPDHSGKVSLPDGAEPFASYGVDGNPVSTDEKGTTYEYTFETPGEYTYVCVPHVRSGMIGTVVVEK